MSKETATSTDALAKSCGGFVLALIVSIYNIFVWGFVLYKCYYWFLTPVFTLPDITYFQAVGLRLFASIFHSLRYTTYIDEKGNRMKPETNYLLAVIAPWLVLGVIMFVRLFL